MANYMVLLNFKKCPIIMQSIKIYLSPNFLFGFTRFNTPNYHFAKKEG